MLTFGMPTLIETTTIEACAGLCKELGLDFIELNMNLPAYQTHRVDIGQLRQVAKDHGIFYTIHLEENLDPCDFNPRIAKAYSDTVNDAIDLARELNAPVLNMHLSRGVYFTLPEQRVYLYEQYRDEYMRGIEAFRDRCADKAQAAGVTICVENSDGFTGFHLQALDMLLEHPAFALTYDVGHDHAIGGEDREAIFTRSHRLKHMHLHDAAGKRNHLTLGSGEIDIPACLALAQEHQCRVVLETKTVSGLRGSVQWLADHHFTGS